MTQNRFVEMSRYLAEVPAPAVRTARPARLPSARYGYVEEQTFSTAMAAGDRALVILLDNGGMDLGIPALVDKILAEIPGSSAIPDSVKRDIVSWLQRKIRETTDTILESAELALNRYEKAKPGQYADVTVLRNSSSLAADLKAKLFSLGRAGKIIDLYILTHGSDRSIAINDGGPDVTDTVIRQWRTDYGAAIPLRSVYMMNCHASTLNQAWIDAGAKVVSGSVGLNVLPEPTTYLFWTKWKAGQAFGTAITSAYHETIAMINGGLRSIVSAVPLVGGPLASRIDVGTLAVIKSSAPVVKGDSSLTISSDALAFSKSLLESTLATVVVPMSHLPALQAPSGGAEGIPVVTHSDYESTASLAVPFSGYSYQQNPAMIGGIAVADAIQIGLGAVAVVQSGIQAGQGSLAFTYDTYERLLTTQARLKMPGAQVPKQKYRQRFLRLDAHKPGFAYADLLVSWEGNAFGEIGAVVMSKDLDNSTDWSRSSATVTVKRISPIPPNGTDPRTWPLTYRYTGDFDPVGNGLWEFEGEFEINAFGGFKVVTHKVASRSFSDFLKQYDKSAYVVRGRDVIPAIPPLPDDQLKYLRANAP